MRPVERKKIRSSSRIGMSLLWVLLLTSICRADADFVDFESDRWTPVNAEVSQHLGRKCLAGIAYLEDVEFDDGIIEVDIAANGTRSYPGVIFRKQSEGNYERFYIRPHRAGLYPDALQYTPGFNGIDGWQLYNGPGYTSGANIPTDQWVHLKVEISGKQARVYLEDMEQPALVITDLKHGVSRGSIGVFGPRDGSSYFSNFRYEIDDGLRFAPAPEIETPPGAMVEWKLSQPFEASRVDFECPPDEQLTAEIEWADVRSDPSGLVDIARYTGRSSQATDCVWAKTSIFSEEKRTMELLFGYSDAISIFLNGDIVFSGNSAYRQRDPSFLGIVGLNDAVYLPLNPGENELLLLIAEAFGGWGFMCVDGDAVFEHESMAKAWQLPRRLSYPESAVYDTKRKVLYVSNFFNNGREFVAKVRPDGQLEQLEWVTGLSRPTGMCIFDDRLYVIDRTGLVEIDIELGQVANRYPIPGAMFANDVSFDASGNAYVSDTRRNVVYRFSGGEFEVWLDDDRIVQPNGLCVDGDMLIVGNSGDGMLKSVRLSDKQISEITDLGAGAILDGIVADGNGNYIASDYNGRVFRVQLSGQKTLLLNTTTPKYFCADLEYILEEDLIVIPTLYDNRLMAYKYTMSR